MIISFYKDKKKTKMALKKAWKSFENILPEFLGVIMLVGVLLAVLDAEVISKIIGSNSGWFGVIAAALVGSITLLKFAKLDYSINIEYNKCHRNK